MLLAVSYALADSVNALLIGIIVAIGIMLPRKSYRKIAPLILIGDWLGVFLCAAIVMRVLDSVKEHVDALLESPVIGWILIVLGLGAAFMAWRSRPGESNALVQKLLVPLQKPSALTFLIGVVMGAAQSITSGPFFIGLIHLAAGDFSAAVRYGGLILYALLALSLPVVVGIFVAIVRACPRSKAGQLFAAARENKHTVSKVGSYVVAVFLVIMGIFSL